MRSNFCSDITKVRVSHRCMKPLCVKLISRIPVLICNALLDNEDKADWPAGLLHVRPPSLTCARLFLAAHTFILNEVYGFLPVFRWFLSSLRSLLLKCFFSFLFSTFVKNHFTNLSLTKVSSFHSPFRPFCLSCPSSPQAFWDRAVRKVISEKCKKKMTKTQPPRR